MNLLERYNLWKAKKRLSPDRAFKNALQRKLGIAWTQKYGQPVWFQTAVFKQAIAAAMVVVIIMGGTGAYAYSSEEITEDNLLYPIKQKIEKFEEKIKVTPEAKAKFYLKQINRREKEKAMLARRGARIEKIEKVEQKIERTEEQLEKTDMVMEKMPMKNLRLREEVKERLKLRFERRNRMLELKKERLIELRGQMEGEIEND